MVLAGQEASGAIVGVKLGASGASMDLAVAFPEDTVMGRACRASIDEPAPAFTRLAQEPFLFAGSIDTAHPGLREVLNQPTPLKLVSKRPDVEHWSCRLVTLALAVPVPLAR